MSPKPLLLPLLMAAALLGGPACAQADSGPPEVSSPMQTLREQLKGGKKELVASYMDLSLAEADAFWPIYDEYQKNLDRINDRLATLLVAFAKEYRADTLTDRKAAELLDDMLAIEEAEARFRRGFVPRLHQVLPGRKVARYMQIENKIRAIVKSELAAEVPLAR
jgi:hypothetical protein